MERIKKIEIYKFNKKYYVAFEENHSDFKTARILKINVEDYQENIKNLCGKNFESEIYFDQIEDAEKVVEWIESIILLNKLCE